MNFKDDSLTFWYDVSDLFLWKLDHFTGIQRTVVGILKGLLETGMPVQLIRFSHRKQEWEKVEINQLPSLAQGFLNATIIKTSREKKELKKKILGSSAEASELRNAFRQFKSSTSKLCNAFSRWICGSKNLQVGLRASYTQPKKIKPLPLPKKQHFLNLVIFSYQPEQAGD